MRNAKQGLGLGAAFVMAAGLWCGPAAAEGMHVGNATVFFGGGVARLELPDINFTQKRAVPQNLAVIDLNRDGRDLIDESGWGLDGGIKIPARLLNGQITSLLVKGFYTNFEDRDGAECEIVNANERCAWTSIVDLPGNGFTIEHFGGNVTTETSRDVDHFGVAVEAQRDLSNGGPRRHIGLGFDYRAIEQDIAIDGALVGFPNNFFDYDEQLETDYYGAYLALSSDFTLPLVGSLTSGLGVTSTVTVRGGLYHAETNYDGEMVSRGNGAFNSTLSLSSDDYAFIGSLQLRSRLPLGPRMALNLVSDYEYYSWVPDMEYNTTGLSTIIPGGNGGTQIRDEDAFSARSRLNLSIKLGPDDLYR